MDPCGRPRGARRDRVRDEEGDRDDEHDRDERQRRYVDDGKVVGEPTPHDAPERDPEWHAALERAEREVGALYARLCEADGTLERWREAIGELYRVWSRVNEAPVEDESAAMPVLEEVA